ncbi:hypothetical protein J3R30DRAFT_3696095 [Lentinula aciculospora]|uniref:Peptidase S9 prolyl oligopeptidase catalytic domain-containing protein n=1 Tax=Lentinula aciculospora TaxID=153920 RepID=A0A9W9AQL7_9AGAR|nr:hypothetical protein J3R30DRAFT_3696095 [Lentinula aciculospora]
MLFSWCIATILVPILAQDAQMTLSRSQWTVELSREWDILGPFPIHAREQHFLEPSFPIDVKVPIDLNVSYPSSYADGGQVTWSKAQANKDSGVLEVLFPDSVRWKALRNTEGWAALQHHAVLKTSLTVYPATYSSSNSRPPHLRVQLVGASYFTITSSNSEKLPRWYAGNIYDMERALPRVVELPTEPALDQPTTYDIFVSGDYEIRLSGDPRVQRNSEIPVQTIKLEVEFDNDTEKVVREPIQDVIPDFVSGWPFGDAIGIGLRARDGWWSVQDARIVHHLKDYLSLNFPPTKFRLAPTQARILPLRIVQHKDLPPVFSSIDVTLNLQRENPSVYDRPLDTISLKVSLPAVHLSMWDEPSSVSLTPQINPVIKGSYFFGVTDSIPTNFLVVPPIVSGKGRAPLLALHGAGVDIFAPTPLESFWAQSLPRQKRSWVVIPSGRTSWGLDWHGPSAQDAWRVLDAVTAILQHSKSTIWGGNKWGIPSTTPGGKPKAIVMGHSNGGQGAWHIAERFPDRVLGVIPASAYIKSQSYVPWIMSRSAHFVDPFLEAILQTSLTPDDNDLFVGNLHGKDVLAIHGDDDENVPVWHTRELVGILRHLRGVGSNTSRVEYLEFLNQPHWFPSVLNNDLVQQFIDKLLNSVELNSTDSEAFSLTVALPAESGSMRGWHVEKLSIPGRLGRVYVSVIGRNENSSFSPTVRVETTNILEFSVDPKLFGVLERDTELWIDGKQVQLDTDILTAGKIAYFKAVEPRIWKLNPDSNTLQLSGRMQVILSSPNVADNSELLGPVPIVFVVPDQVVDSESGDAGMLSHPMSVALRLSHDLCLYHQLDSEIMVNSEVDVALSKPNSASALGRGNVVIVGNEAASGLQIALQSGKANFVIENSFIGVEEFAAKVHANKINPNEPRLQPRQGVLFLHPHPMNPFAKMILLQSTDSSGIGLERAMRLFPVRTGLPVPDWIIVGEEDGRGEGNVIAAGLWDSEWNWNRAMSWSSTI